jgi:murein DD-endopeptidase MepM/ murein hydrolase activator NlpD
MPTASRQFAQVFALAVATAPLMSCSGDQFGRTFGFIRDAPDEFTVTTRAPLAMPTNFNLPPPRPGAARPQEQSERTKAELALVPQMALGGQTAGESPGQEALVQAAGPPVSSAVRAEVDQEAAKERPKQGVADRLIFWRKPPPRGIVVDPQKETQRLRENSALGQNQNTGETPIVQPKQRAWLEGIF